MEVKVTLNLDSKEEELLKKVVEKLGSENTPERTLSNVISSGSKWDTFLYEKMCNYLMLMGGCTYEESKNMLDEYKRSLKIEYEKHKKVDELFKALPISRVDFVLATGKYIDSEVDMNYIIRTWNECNNDEGKYLIITKDYGIEFGLKEHSLLEEGTVTYETLKSDVERVESLSSSIELEEDELEPEP